jgi:Zn-dependent protease with chaperone function
VGKPLPDMLLLPPILFLACFVLTALAARREGGGALRALGAAAFVAALCTAPAAVLAWVTSVYELDTSELILGGAAVLVVFAVTFRGVKQPFEHARPMEDPATEAALARVAQRAGLARTPGLLRLRTLGSLPAYAWVAVPHHPTVILADGLVHRLDPEEREAILAHEVAHIATGSLWWLQLPLPVAATISMAALVWVDMWVAAGSTWALWALLARLLGRPTERTCDRRAGELTSPGAMISALRKVHAVHPVRDPGWRWTVAWALATHPPAQLRIHDLGEDQGPVAQRLRRTSVAGFSLWGLAFLAVLSTWTLLPGLSSVIIGLALASLGLGLQLSPRLAARSSLQRQRRLAPPGLPGHRVGRAGWLLFILGCASTWTDWLGWWTAAMMLGALVCLGLSSFLGRGLSARRKRVLEAIRREDFEAAHRIGLAHPRALRRDPQLRYNTALASLAAGYTRDGMEGLEEVVRRAHELPIAALTLGRMKLAEDPERSLELGRWLSVSLEGDPLGPLLQCAALRRLGRRAEALLAWELARTLDPEEPGVLIEAVELALDAGALEEAERWASQARERAPGELDLQLAELRLALVRGDHDRAHERLARIRAVLADHPLAFVDQRVAELEAQLNPLAPDPSLPGERVPAVPPEGA